MSVSGVDRGRQTVAVDRQTDTHRRTQTDKGADTLTHREKDRETSRLTDRQTGGQADGQTQRDRHLSLLSVN